MDETEPIPAALLAEALLLAADDHHRRLGVRLTDLMPPVVLAAPAEIRAAAVDGARLRAGTSPGRAGPPPGSRRPRRPRALGETRGEILEPPLGVGGGGGGGGRAREGQHDRAGVRRRRAPRRSPGSCCPVHAAGQEGKKTPPPCSQPRNRQDGGDNFRKISSATARNKQLAKKRASTQEGPQDVQERHRFLHSQG